MVTKMACNVNITSFSCTGFIPLGCSWWYSACKEKSVH